MSLDHYFIGSSFSWVYLNRLSISMPKPKQVKGIQQLQILTDIQEKILITLMCSKKVSVRQMCLVTSVHLSG